MQTVGGAREPRENKDRHGENPTYSRKTSETSETGQNGADISKSKKKNKHITYILKGEVGKI